jgi:predicted kinase
MTAGTLYFLIGKMGAGKSTYAKRFAQDNGTVLISEDDWLSQLYPGEINNFNDFLVRHRKLLTVLRSHVPQILAAGTSVIMDFPANTRDARQWFLRVAESANAPHQAIYLELSDDACLQQVAKRRQEQPERSQFDTPEMFAEVTQYFQAPGDDEGLNIVVVKPGLDS